MRRLLYILTILTLVSCSNQIDTPDNPAKPQNISKNTFAACFANIDTSKAGESISCAAGAYKLISDKLVIGIYPDFPVQLDSCYTISIDSSNGEQLAELLIFDNRDANLTNICTDVIVVNNPAPTRQLHAQSGQLIIGFSDTTQLYGHTSFHTTILIKNLIFTDSKTGEIIELENELIWKVINRGIPG